MGRERRLLLPLLGGEINPFSCPAALKTKVKKRKEVLTFFYEVPLNKVGKNQSSFGQEVGRRKDTMLRQYYSDNGCGGGGDREQ